MDNKKKKTYSMTAKERKAQRLGHSVKDVQREAEPVVVENSPAGVVSVNVKLPSERAERNMPLIIFCAVALAAIIMLMAVLTTTVFTPMYLYRDINNPVAVISLSNGDKFEMEIYENEVPYGATNFLYLASKGFFDDTIIFDTTNQYVRFGQYQTDEYKETSRMSTDERLAYEATVYRTRNPEFLKRITDITIPSNNYADSVFDYKMNKDTANSANVYDNLSSTLGYLSNTYNLSGTEFQICGEGGQPLRVNRKDSNATGASSTYRDMSGYVIGRCANEQSFEIVKKIANLEQEGLLDNGHPFWRAPAQTLRIKKVKLYKMDMRGKWRDFKWDNWFSGNNTVSWSGGSGIIG